MRIKMPTSMEEARQFKPLDPGVYHVKIKDVKAKMSGKGNPQLNWTLEVIEPIASARRLCWYSTPWMESAMGFLADLAEAIGEEWDDSFEIDIDESDPTNGDPGRFAEWVGSELDVLVDIQIGTNGKPYNSVKILRS